MLSGSSPSFFFPVSLSPPWRDVVLLRAVSAGIAEGRLLASRFPLPRENEPERTYDELLRLAESEAALAQQLQAAGDQRQRILQSAGRKGLPCKSLSDLAHSIAGDEGGRLQSRIQRASGMSNRIRRESWIHWIIAHRACSHYTNLLNLIANCGKKAPTYSKESCEESRGGVILDASI